MAMLLQSPFFGVPWITTDVDSPVTSDAQWIWVAKPGQARPTLTDASPATVRFSVDVRLADKVAEGKLNIAVDNSCELKVNGRVVQTVRDYSRLTAIDLKPFLRTDVNHLEFAVTNEPGVPGGNPAGLLCFGSIRTQGGEVIQLSSDSTWKSPDGETVVLGPFSTPPWNLSDTPDVPCPIFKRAFRCKSAVRKATARVIGLGHYDLYVNGARQGKGVCNQAWSEYDRTLYWQEFDVTKALHEGPNTIGTMMANSFFRVATPPGNRYAKGDAMPDFSENRPFLLALELSLTYMDGTSERITTDADWRYGPSPIVFSHVFAGEDYDARKLSQSWAAPDFSEGWKPVTIAATPRAELRQQSWPELRPVQSFKPVKIIRRPKNGAWSYVFAQNASAILRFRVKGRAGSTIKFRPSEVMSTSGDVQQLNLWGGEASCSYTLRGGSTETHEWRFWYHGFQFVELTGGVPAGFENPKGLPVIESLEMVHVRTDNAEISAFHTSSDLYNRIFGLVDWAMRSNMSYVMTDCPHREKLGWLECAHLLFPSFAYRYDCRQWFHKIARDLRDIQLSDGRFTTVAPDYLMRPDDDFYKFTVEWGAAGVLMPWQAYEWYGDLTFLSENYDSMKRFVDWIDAHAVDGLAPKGLGDWYDYGHGQPPGPSRYTPTDLTSTAVWAMCARAVADSADALGKKSDAAYYHALHAKIREDFLRHFYHSETYSFENSGSVQSGSAMALCADLVPSADRPHVLARIMDELKARGYQQTAGDVGHRFFIQALAEAGRSDVLHQVYSRTGIGSYGGILAKGLTTMPETWDAITVGSNSLNHCMLGHIMEWFHAYVLGVRQARGSVGWKRVIIGPSPGKLTSCSGKVKTPQGTIDLSWKKLRRQFELTVSIPRGCSAEIEIPDTTSLFLDGKTWNSREIPTGKHTITAKTKS